MAYEFYRNSAPGWGTSQFQFGAPPAPMFQPQPSWGGVDFFNAHAINPDPGLYHSAISRAGLSVRSSNLSRDDARYWHKRIYGGMIPLTQVLPADLGAAAAYEAYRTWKSNSFLYEPLSADRAQQRDALVGMAMGEATRLWQFAGRTVDSYGLRNACEASAATAGMLADRWIRRGAYGGTPPQAYAGIGGGGGYTHRPRRSSFAVGGSPPFLGVPIAGLQSGSPHMNASNGGSPYMSSTGGSPYGPTMGIPGVSPGLSAVPGATAVPPLPQGLPESVTSGVGYGSEVGMGGVSGGMIRAGGLGAGAGYPGATGVGVGVPPANVHYSRVPAGSTVVFERPSRSRARFHEPGRRHRARSVDVIETMPPSSLPFPPPAPTAGMYGGGGLPYYANRGGYASRYV